jgi:very-short-patch-repair endonuclease
MVEVARAFRKAPTASEEKLWSALRQRQIVDAKFRRQQPIGPFIVDFYCAQHHLVVEVDGPIHDNQREHDRARQALLEACGFQVLRISAHEIETYLPAVLIRINHAIALRDRPLAP